MLDDLLIEETEFDEFDYVDEFPQDFVSCCNKLVVECLEDFFETEKFYCGGSINSDLFCSENCVNTVLNTDIKNGVPYAYSIMKEEEEEWSYKNEDGVGNDTALVLDVFEKCASLSIPKCFRAGILIIYLQLCYGCKVRK